jgi:hypothetical protein
MNPDFELSLLAFWLLRRKARKECKSRGSLSVSELSELRNGLESWRLSLSRTGLDGIARIGLKRRVNALDIAVRRELARLPSSTFSVAQNYGIPTLPDEK